MLAVGASAPRFVLGDGHGKVTSFDVALAHGPVALFFVKSGCGATALAAPFAERLWQGYREHVSAETTRFTLLGISQEDQEETKRFAREHGVTFPLLVDADLAVSRLYDLEATPTMVLVRGAERLRADAEQVPAVAWLRIVDVVEGWSREGYQLLSEDVAARVGALPVDLFAAADDVPATRPG
jgi:peroxiredoxin